VTLIELWKRYLKTMTITKVFRARHYWFNGDRVWFEESPAVHETDRFITVRSVTYSTIQYPGGDFRLSKQNLEKFNELYLVEVESLRASVGG
jgi:hypothetical protein